MNEPVIRNSKSDDGHFYAFILSITYEIFRVFLYFLLKIIGSVYIIEFVNSDSAARRTAGRRNSDIQPK